MTELVLKTFDGLRTRKNWFATAWTVVAVIPVVLAVLDPGRVVSIVSFAVAALAGTLPFIVVAVLLIGYLKATGAEAVVARAFEGRETRMIVLAALFGGLAPFCSCEVIPFVAGLLAVGAPLSAVMAFWLSSPLIDPPTVLITASALGWDFAIGKGVAAVALGLLGGFGVRLLISRGAFKAPLRAQVDSGCCGCGPSVFEGKPMWRFWQSPARRETFRNEALNNALFLLKWLSVAYLLEALLVTYVPAEAIAQVVGGDGFLSIVTGALVGAPAYLNGYAAPALVSGLMEQGMSASSAMAFMVSGSVSSVPAMVAVWSLVQRPVFFAYLGFGVVGAVIIGAVFGAIV
ncbi:MAG: permease [Gammaproteobacteria bacterium]|nr:permease [Gammaproteobacteria bacterium]